MTALNEFKLHSASIFFKFYFWFEFNFKKRTKNHSEKDSNLIIKKYSFEVDFN